MTQHLDVSVHCRNPRNDILIIGWQAAGLLRMLAIGWPELDTANLPGLTDLRTFTNKSLLGR
jgi:hypothetical protein